jgi:hypothetical protein
MLDSQSPPLVDMERPTAERPASGRSARDSDARSNPRIDRRPTKLSIDSPSYRFGEGPLASGRPSIGRRIFRALARFSITVLIGVGVTLGWQSYGDVAKEMLVARAPTLAWVLPVLPTKSPVVAATSPDPMQQLGPLASNLDVVRRNVEQLAARQEQMAQSIAAMQAVEEDIRQNEEDIRQKMSSAPSPPAQQAASISQPKPPQPRAQSSALQPSSVPRPPALAGPQLSR